MQQPGADIVQLNGLSTLGTAVVAKDAIGDGDQAAYLGKCLNRSF